jgi:hypothetical protein
VKQAIPSAGTYETFKPFGSQMIEGGAPNNFLKERNTNSFVPFGRKVKKGWLNFEKGKSKNLNIFVEPELDKSVDLSSESLK